MRDARTKTEPVPCGSRPSCWPPSRRHRSEAACMTWSSSRRTCNRMDVSPSNGIRTPASCRSPSPPSRRSRARQLLPLPRGPSRWRFRAANHTDLAISFEIRGLHLRHLVDALLAKFFLELVHRDELTAHVSPVGDSVPHEQKATRRRESTDGNEMK